MERIQGKVLWYDKRDGYGIIQDSNGNEFYVSSDVLVDLRYLDAKDDVTFEVNPSISMPPCAYKVQAVHQCEGGNAVGKDGEPCDAEKCQECCPHNEHDHFICLDCEKELDVGSYIDAAEYSVGGDR